MLKSNTVPQTDTRNYLLISEQQWLLLKGYARRHSETLAAITEHFLSLGLERANELYMQEEIDNMLRPRPDGLRYVISRLEKKYLVVSPEIHNKVTEFAREKKIKLIEATRNLIGLGMLAEFRVDPRDNPQYESRMEIIRLIEEYWQETHPGKSMKEKYGPRYQEKMEAVVLRDIAFPGKNRQGKQRRSGQPRKSRDKKLGLRDMLDLALIFGGGFLLAENIELKRENEELRRIIAGEATAGEKCGRPENGPVAEKHEDTPSQSIGWMQQSDPSQP